MTFNFLPQRVSSGMNFLSNDHIWLLPPRTGSRATFDTMHLNGINIVQTNGHTFAGARPYTHALEIPEEYSKYPVIVNVRNPYTLVFSQWKLAQSLAIRPYSPYLDILDKMPLWFDEVKNGEDGTTATKVYLSNPPVLDSFKDWMKISKNKKIAQKYVDDGKVVLYKPKKLPEKIDYIVRLENYKEDILKVPGVTKLNTTNPCTTQYNSTLLKYVIVCLTLFDNYNTNYFTSFIESNPKIYNAIFKTTPKSYSQIQLKKLYGQLKEIPDNKLKTFLRNFFIVPDGFKEKVKLIDLYTLYSEDWRSFYTQELADMVYENMQEWFERFNYDRDSWKK